ncbi:hypothetical protein JXL21_07265 [Candidatus Bathyarchaeota archaeon]|nr:hypothetical protein [Candidatus Bathyarchaeota archaeon]
MKGCRVCGKETVEGSVYCDRHMAAYDNLEKAYAKWRVALEVNWEEYLEKVQKLPGTGKWVKEVAQDVLSG